MNTALQVYRSVSAESGITHFVLLPNAIIILFRDGSAYLYTGDRPGAAHVLNMSQRATAGKGLTTYINQHVRSNYADRLSPQQVKSIRDA